MRFTRVLVPTDFSELSSDAVRLALEIARSDAAAVTVYHVVEYDELAPNYGVFMYEFTPKSERPVPKLIEERRRLLVAFLRENFADLLPHVKIHCEVEVGRPYKQILERAAEDGTDLIVMATHGRTGLSHALIGSVTERVVRLATCPVLSVHPKKITEQADIQAD
jgi:nucleotide-binding universal stress UspA family protein